jgi:hypothetical protein
VSKHALWQHVPPPQECPQLAQLFGSLVMSEHTPLQQDRLPQE